MLEPRKDCRPHFEIRENIKPFAQFRASFVKGSYPLLLLRSLKKAVERQSKEDGTSINQFVATAVAEKLSALQTAEFFFEPEGAGGF